MKNKIFLLFLIFGIVALCPQIAFGDEIIVENADAVWNSTLDNATEVKHLVGEPGVMVTKYADAFIYYLLKEAIEIHHLVGEPGVMVTKYADTFIYEGLTAPPFVQYAEYFDTGEGTYPSIMGTHKGVIKPSDNITISKLYTYPCAGTGGHTKSIELYENDTLIASGTWDGYQGDWHNITIHNVSGAPYVILLKGHEYNYTIRTGSYPQIIHEHEYDKATGGTITCTLFTDVNGKTYTDWIPAIRLV